MAKPVARRGEGRERVLQAALGLFVEHGVSGTSLQMIADVLGVTKAAVYFQFHSKEEIALALLEPPFAQIAEVVSAAEAESSRAARRDVSLTGLVDLIVQHRGLMAALERDPTIGRLTRAREPFKGLIERLGLLLTGPDPGPSTRVAVTMVGAGLSMSGVDPGLADLEDDVLRRELLRSARILLGATAPG